MTLQELINKHLDQIRKDFEVPWNSEVLETSDLRSWGDSRIIELPKTLDGMGQPFLNLAPSLDGDGTLDVTYRIKITPRGKYAGPAHNLILESRKYQEAK